MPRLIPKLRRTKSQDASDMPKLRRSKSDDTGNRMPRRLRLRSRSRTPRKQPRGLGDNFCKDLDDSNTSATMDSSSSCDSGAVRVRLQRNATFDNNNNSCNTTMSPEQQLRHNRLKELPSTANFASSHVLVNRERMRLGKAPLHRSRDLDAIARSRATEMAQGGPGQLKLKIEKSMAENQQCGPSIRIIHQMIMGGVDDESRNNILSDHYTRFGVGCASDGKGTIYMSQIFQAPAVFSQELKCHPFSGKEEEESNADNIEESKELL